MSQDPASEPVRGVGPRSSDRGPTPLCRTLGKSCQTKRRTTQTIT